MLDITKLNASLWTSAATESIKLARQRGGFSSADSPLPLAAANPKPVVTWSVTRSCNLNCLHDSQLHPYGSELTTTEGIALITNLAAFRVPRLLFAGGEPLLRADLPELVAYARQLGIPSAIVTDGTLLTWAQAVRLKRAGLHSVSILLEGIGRGMDRTRGVRAAFDTVLEGYQNCEDAGLSAEIRAPLNLWSHRELADLLDLVERIQIRRVVFAHLVNTGRRYDPQDDLTHVEKRRALDLMLERAEDFHRRGVGIKIATDENHADGIYLYLRSARRNPRRAAAAYRLLPEWGASVQGSGVGIAGVDSVGDVHPDRYWAHHTLGNVRQTPFSEIWEKSPDPLLRGLRDRLPLLKGKCANCRWKQACGGNLRVRAEEVFGDPWMSDPACYLTNEEIGKGITEQVETMEDDVLLTEQAA